MLIINLAMAQGWAKNDEGQYLYYKDSKALTGIHTIDGVKYYLFSTGVFQIGLVQDGNNCRLSALGIPCLLAGEISAKMTAKRSITSIPMAI